MTEQSDWDDWSDDGDEDEEVELVDTKLRQLTGLGPKSVERLKEHNIKDVDDLEQACKARELSKIEGFGRTLEVDLLDEIKLARKGVYERKTREEAEDYWQMVKQRLEDYIEAMPGATDIGRYEPTGSFRREEDTVGDLDVIIEADESQDIYQWFEGWREVDQILVMGSDKMSFRIDMMQVDLLVVPTESYGSALMYFTGSAGHNRVVRGIAKSKGYRLDEWGLFEYEDGEYGERIAGEIEQEIYDALGLRLLSPDQRYEDNIERVDQ